MEKRGRKGQAAMEFLMTYGWAILAAIIAIGVLAYFGVFSPGKFMPSACAINAPLGCDEFKLDATADTVTIVVRNGAGSGITITDTAISLSTPVCTTQTTDYPVIDGAAQTIVITCTGLTTGEKFKGDILVTYTKTGGTLDQTASGTITGKVP